MVPIMALRSGPPRLFHFAAGAALAAALATGAAPPVKRVPAPATAPTFESHWQDGRAELAGYRYRVTRYGARREGRCAMITVTEPFSASKYVKADDPAADPKDTFEALKLNLVRHFQTGIYDYHTMVSLFTRSRDFAPVKVAFTCAEWCGQVYEEEQFEPRTVSGFVRSYFEGESRTIRLPARAGGIAEDDLFLLLRGLRGDYLPPGRTRPVHLIASPFIRRLAHRSETWLVAGIARSRDPQHVVVPAGSFDGILYTVKIEDGRTGRFWVEAPYPHRILKWAWTAAPAKGAGRMAGDGLDEGALIRSSRLPYWRLNRPGDERYLEGIGLER
jgi:hypothetical protein